ncbi:hypothetical protein [Corynebacterium aquatimens]|uniref:Tyr recombinase domain-containing protein n=1 Tax=Corynebacterium aquatimens TaxID=1190508 RepID=A0A931GWF1_9CORY|nr:hypothetical protein [Corynebacterium aquatimens]MBG6122506.1 hypothetical protein [Corynebacterium aquatimens]
MALVAAGADVYAVQRMCGHADASTTLNVYGHLWDEGLDAIPNAIDAYLTAERERDAARETPSRSHRPTRRTTRSAGRGVETPRSSDAKAELTISSGLSSCIQLLLSIMILGVEIAYCVQLHIAKNPGS